MEATKENQHDLTKRLFTLKGRDMLLFILIVALLAKIIVSMVITDHILAEKVTDSLLLENDSQKSSIPEILIGIKSEFGWLVRVPQLQDIIRSLNVPIESTGYWSKKTLGSMLSLNNKSGLFFINYSFGITMLTHGEYGNKLNKKIYAIRSTFLKSGDSFSTCNLNKRIPKPINLNMNSPFIACLGSDKGSTRHY